MSKDIKNYFSKLDDPNHSLDYQTGKMDISIPLDQYTRPLREALQASEARYRLIEDNILDLIATFDPESLEFTYLSPSHFKLFGYKEEEARSSICFDFIHPDDSEAAKALFDEGIKVGYGATEYRVRKKDGTYIWVEANAKLIKGLHGRDEVLLVNRDITNRKCTEEALKASEEKYRLIVDNIYNLICIVDAEKQAAVYANPAQERILGYLYEEYSQQNIFDLIHPEDTERVIEALELGLIMGENTVSFRYRKKDGTYIWLETHGKVMKEQTKWLFTSRDISERKQAEDAIREQEQKLQMITDNMLDGIIFFNSEKKVEYAGPSFKKILGYQAFDIEGAGIDLIGIYPDDREIIKQFVNEYEKMESINIQCRAIHAQGHYVWIEAIGKAIHTDKTFAGWVFGIRDISARKRAEEELQKQLDYRNYLMDNMNESYYTYDQNLKLTFINKKACETLGYSLEEMLGRSVFDFIFEEDREMVKANALTSLREGDTATYEHRAISKDGRALLMRIRVAPIFKDGQITGGQIVAEDVTPYRKMEKEMVRLAQLHTVGEIAAGIGHEIRNPMTTVRGFLQILAQDPDIKHYRQSFDLMMEELDRANAIISEFLSLAKDKIADFQRHNLNAIIRTIFPLLQADAMVADKLIQLDLEEIPELWLDDKEIRQLVINLVRNGLEAMEPGGAISIQTRKQYNEVILTIKDQGKGIDEEVKEKLGTPFFTTKENGTGLGLAICYSIIRRHNANIKIESEKTGTSIIISFHI